MPRFFLHVQDATDLLQDPDGQELPDSAAAKQEAIEAARELMAEDLRRGEPLGLHRIMVIADANGVIVADISFASALPPEP